MLWRREEHLTDQSRMHLHIYGCNAFSARLERFEPKAAMHVLLSADKHGRPKVLKSCLAGSLADVPWDRIPDDQVLKLSKKTLLALVSDTEHKLNVPVTDDFKEGDQAHV